MATREQKAEKMIRYFEENGREVVGVMISKDGIKLDFKSTSDAPSNSADPVRMDQ